MGDGSASATSSSMIWKPVEEFLVAAKSIRAKAIQHTCKMKYEWKEPVSRLLSPSLDGANDSQRSEETRVTHPSISSSQFPTIVLSHVPLYRSGETTCGPMRERGSVIPLQAGYQYQNALTPLISHDIVKHLIAEEITMIYSGDDHDYCEIEHNEFTGRIREITVKSMSWAMGVRKPGVQLVSLWNPVDVFKAMSSDPNLSTPRGTVQNHMCLLPDQLSIFIRYGQIAGLTLLILLLGAIRYSPSTIMAGSQHEKSEPLLPISASHHGTEFSKSSCVQNTEVDSRLSTRKMGGYGQLPAPSRTSSPSKPPYINLARNSIPDERRHSNDWDMHQSLRARMMGRHRPPTTKLAYLGRSMWRTVWPVLVFYMWLLWNG